MSSGNRIHKGAVIGATIALFSVQCIFSSAASAGAHAPGKAVGKNGGITEKAIAKHLEKFESIAEAQGGHRASGTPGHRISVDYTERLLKKAGFTTERQRFPFLYTETLKEKLTLRDGTSPDVVVTGYSPSTPKGGTERQLAVPGGPRPATGCSADDYRGTPVSGRTALVQAGACDMDTKERVAADVGAGAVLVANTGPGELHSWLAEPGEARIPVGGVSATTGQRLVREAAAGRPVRLELRSLTERRTTENLIAESPRGDPEHTVVSGAHLDSTPDGPGINDNGVAAAVLLESALSAARAGGPGPANRQVFAFWGAEEFGLLGSEHYVDALSAPERERTELYLNLEMIGSPNYALFTLDPDATDPVSGQRPAPGSDRIARRLTQAFAAQGVASRDAPADGRSDYVPFLAAGIPTGGLYGGSFEAKTQEQAELWGGAAGAPFDACYHLPCDRTDHYSPRAALLHGRAFDEVRRHYARHPLPGPETGENGETGESGEAGESGGTGGAGGAKTGGGGYAGRD